MPDVPSLDLTPVYPTASLASPSVPQLALVAPQLGGALSSPQLPQVVLTVPPQPSVTLSMFGYGGVVTGDFATAQALYATGSYLYNLETGISGYLQNQIVLATAGVAILNGLSGVIDIGVRGGLSLTVAGQNVLISGKDWALSGDLAATGALLQSQLAALSGFVSQVSGGLEVKIAQSGQAAVGYATSVGTSLSGVLTQTGSTLYQLLTGLSGQAGTDYATVAALAATGSTLYQLVTGTSGSLLTRLEQTGQAAYLAGVGGDLALSGALTATGQTVLGVINSLSGFVTGVSGGLEVRIAQSGAAAVAYSNLVGTAISGSLATTGQQAWSAANDNGINLSGNLTATGATLIARDLAISGALQVLIDQANGDVTSLNGQSGALVVAGTGGLTVLSGAQGLILVSGDQSISGALTQSGVLLGASIANTGQQAFNLYTGLSGALSQSGATLLAAIAATGGQAWSAANANAVNLSGNLTQTGVQLVNLINGMSGQAEALFVHRTGNELITGIKTFASELRFNSGIKAPARFFAGGNYSIVSGDQTVISLGNLTNMTGILPPAVDYSGVFVNLINGGTTSLQISGLVGPDVNPLLAPWDALQLYAASGRWWPLRQTGSPLLPVINALSGYVNSTATASGQALYSAILGLSGVVTSTGGILGLQISALSGFIVGTSGALQGQIALTGQQAWTAAQNNALNLSGSLGQTGNALVGLVSNLYIGTPSQTFQIQTGSSGIVLKNTQSGLYLRNYNDSIGGDLVVRNLTVEGTQTINNAQNLAVSNQYIYLNVSGAPQDGGLEFLRSGSPAASVLWSESDNRWKAGLSGTESTIILASDTGQFASAVALFGTGSTLYRTITGLSGQSVIDYATKLSLGLTGASLYALLTGESGSFKTEIALTGQQAWSAADNNGLNLSGNLTLTGLTLFVRDLSISGALDTKIGATGSITWNAATNNAVNLSGNMAATGAALIDRDTAISGGLQSQIAQTGQLAWISANGAAGTLSGLLTATGQTLYQILTGSSGQFNTNYATVVNLALTGSNLYVLATGLSGTFNTQVASTGQQAWTAANSNGLNLSGNLTQTGVALIARDLAISGGLEVRITASGVSAITHANGIGSGLSGNLTQTGATLFARDAAISGGLEARISVTGQQAWISANGAATALSGNLTTTGQNLYVLVTGMSGAFNSQIALTGQQAWSAANGNGINISGNMAASGVALILRDLAISGVLQTQIDQANADVVSINGQSGTLTIGGTGGLTVISGGPGLILISGDQSISGALTQSGVVLGAQITALSGFVGQVSGGLEVRLFATGSAAVAHANGIGSILSGNLTTTGQTLYQLVTGASGQANLNYATIQNLALTGSSLYVTVTGLSGAFVSQIVATGSQAWNATNSNGLNLSGNLTLTGQTLRALTIGGDTNLSGNLTLTGASLYVTLTGLSGQFSTNRNLWPSVTVAANYSVTANPGLIYCNNSNPITLTFPTPSTVSGFAWTVKLVNTGAVYLTGSLFDGQPSYMLTVPYAAQTVHAQTAGYYLI